MSSPVQQIAQDPRPCGGRRGFQHHLAGFGAKRADHGQGDQQGGIIHLAQRVPLRADTLGLAEIMQGIEQSLAIKGNVIASIRQCLTENELSDFSGL